jgi:hypothetical protein
MKSRRFDHSITSELWNPEHCEVVLTLPPLVKGNHICRVDAPLPLEIEYCFNRKTLSFPAATNEENTKEDYAFTLGFFSRHDLYIGSGLNEHHNVDESNSALNSKSEGNPSIDLAGFAFPCWTQANPTVVKSETQPGQEVLFRRLLLAKLGLLGSEEVHEKKTFDGFHGHSTSQLACDPRETELASQFNKRSGHEWLRTLRQYRVAKGSIPTAEKLVEWGSSDLEQRAVLFPGDIQTALDVFLDSYVKVAKRINDGPNLPEVSLTVMCTFIRLTLHQVQYCEAGSDSRWSCQVSR